MPNLAFEDKNCIRSAFLTGDSSVIQTRHLCLGVDLGGTKVMAAVADATGSILAEMVAKTDKRGGRFVIDQIGQLADTLLSKIDADGSTFGRAVVGIPGAVHPTFGSICLIPNIRGFSELDVSQGLSNRLGLNVEIENDVNLAALGESWVGCAKDCRNVSFIALGTGIGLGQISDGKLIRGGMGAAGEIAYLPIGIDINSSEALAIGSLELEVGSKGIVERYNSQKKIKVKTVKDVFTQLKSGDPIAIAVIDHTAKFVALAIASICAIMDPEVVVLGGSVGSRPELLECVEHYASKMLTRRALIVISELNNRAGLIGALSLASCHSNCYQPHSV